MATNVAVADDGRQPSMVVLAWRFVRDRVPAALTVGLSAACFVPALILPFFWLVPGFGDPILAGLLEVIFGQTLSAYAYSVLGGITALYRDGEVLVATVLLLFSVIFPMLKLILLFLTTRRSKWLKGRHSLVQKLGPWSMLDVFVVSLTVLAFKSFPGGTRVYPGIGFYFFLASVVLSIIASYQVIAQISEAKGQIGVSPTSRGLLPGSNLEIIDLPPPDPSGEMLLRMQLAIVSSYTLAILDDCRSPKVRSGTAVLIRIGDRLFAATAAHCIGSAPYLAFDAEFAFPPEPTPARKVVRHPTLDIALIELNPQRTARGCGLENLDVSQPVVPIDPRKPGPPGFWIVGFPADERSQTNDALFLALVSVGTHPVAVADTRYTFTYPIRFVRMIDGVPVSGTSPESPFGFSGGGIWRFAEPPAGRPIFPGEFVRLTAIQVEWLGTIRHAYCVPIRHWIELVYDYYPDLRSLLASRFSFLSGRPPRQVTDGQNGSPVPPVP